MKHAYVYLMIAFTAVGCGVQEQAAETKALAADKAAVNVALLFTGDASGIPGVHQDPGNVERVLTDPSLDMRFQVGKFNGKTISQIEQQSAKTAQAMKGSSPNGTLLWYFSGHGSQDGQMIAAGGSGFNFESVARAMRTARGDTAFKRLIVLIDACFAGNAVNGNTQITANSGSGIGGGGNSNPFSGLFALTTPVVPPAEVVAGQKASQDQAVQSVVTAAQPMQGRLYEQLIVIASSRANETSGDSSAGGVGTIAFLNAIKSLRANPNATIDQALQLTVRGAMGQTPVYRTEPESVKQELLFGELPALQNNVAQPLAAQQKLPSVVTPTAASQQQTSTPTAQTTSANNNNAVGANSMFNAGM